MVELAAECSASSYLTVLLQGKVQADKGLGV